MRSFLSELRESLPPDREDLLRLFDTFANEAIVAREWLSPSLDKLPKESKVLEVGAGLMLLSCQLKREGFRATALEPIGSGFSIFLELQNHVRLVATQKRVSGQRYSPSQWRNLIFMTNFTSLFHST